MVETTILPAIKRVQGVGSAEFFGAAKTYTMRIWLNPEAMKQHNLIPNDVTDVLAEQNVEAAPGKFDELRNKLIKDIKKRKR
jgi:HAE1 family hydrophobic/amphiphilic exporter-1